MRFEDQRPLQRAAFKQLDGLARNRPPACTLSHRAHLGGVGQGNARRRHRLAEAFERRRHSFRQIPRRAVCRTNDEHLVEREAAELLEQCDIARECLRDPIDPRRTDCAPRNYGGTDTAAESDNVGPMKRLDRRVVAVCDHPLAIRDHRRGQVNALAAPMQDLDARGGVRIYFGERARELREKYWLSRGSFNNHMRACNQRDRYLVDSGARDIARRDKSNRLRSVYPAVSRNQCGERLQRFGGEWFQERVDRIVEGRDRETRRTRDCRDRLAPARVIAAVPERERARQCVGHSLRAGTGDSSLPARRAGNTRAHRRPSAAWNCPIASAHPRASPPATLPITRTRPRSTQPRSSVITAETDPTVAR